VEQLFEIEKKSEEYHRLSSTYAAFESERDREEDDD
jgi:hypothetical protein